MSLSLPRRPRAALIGAGGIAAAHLAGMRMDARMDPVAGVLSRDQGRAAEAAARYGIAAERSHADLDAFIAAETARDDGAEVAVVLTPDDLHFEYAAALLQAGFHVVLEKPVAATSTQAQHLVDLAAERDRTLAVPHVYSAYPLVRQAARMVRDGRLGALRHVEVEFASGWGAAALEAEDPQRWWRLDPRRSGRYTALTDLGTHAHHLLRFVTGLEVEELGAQLAVLVPGRQVYDDASVQVSLGPAGAGSPQAGVPARIWATIAATGHPHGLRLRVIGSEGNLEWIHEDPHHLRVQDAAGTSHVITQGQAGLVPEAERFLRAPAGHPEGFLEAFANFYAEVAEDIASREAGHGPLERELGLPTGRDGVLGMQFVEAAARSHQEQAVVRMPERCMRR